ncbi:hypothetical protein OK015_16475 [Mycobacterium sp. Aquia_216]|uniref:AbiJ-related protein n=1 Tax=Mycobacterium sp. Aquia_216 TaxID=2991729 RepID=UPI00227AD4A9|nr:hypothetical protein [Mycobacterium sp. Aquia_216]WAJ42856.1 hypothetical protein OK015_16475 [Mycobacterium sp. Aquia_216]
MADVDFAALRGLLIPLIEGLCSCTHRELDIRFAELGLVEPPQTQGSSRSRAQRVQAVAAGLPDSDLPSVAGRVLSTAAARPVERVAIEDILWAPSGAPRIPKRTRREIAAALALEDLVVDERRFTTMLESLWPLEPPNPFDALLGTGPPRPALWGPPDLRALIYQHVYRNPGDWSTEDLFEHLGAFEAADRRFGLFLEAITSADVVLHEPNQRAIVDTINPSLRQCGLHLAETDIRDGYPVFTVARHAAGGMRRPKNLIFASPRKPDLRLTDALDNDIEILTGADDVLVYDRPIGPGGLRWRDLQAWWQDAHPENTPKQAKSMLYQRLLRAIPRESPPQQLLFTAYHKIFGEAIPALPALLPEVWLHWDPKTIQQRGADALLRFRMDFLMLAGPERIVIEVDGAHHYAHPDGRRDPVRYAAMMSADRDLRLSGYEVFRFGAEDLRDPVRATPMLTDFFQTLFDRHGVTRTED